MGLENLKSIFGSGVQSFYDDLGFDGFNPDSQGGSGIQNLKSVFRGELINNINSRDELGIFI